MSSGKILKTLTGAMYVDGRIYEPQTVDKVTFLTSENIVTEFKDSYIIDFPKYNKSGSTDFVDWIYTGTSYKVKVNISLVYQWVDMVYSPRFSVEILINDVLDKRRSNGMMDSYEDENTLDETFLINIIAGDKLTIRLRKDNDEVNTLRIENNSFLEFSAF